MLTEILSATEASPWLTTIRTSPVLYPLLNGTHIVGLALLFGAIAVFDLRVLREGTVPSDGSDLFVARIGLGVAIMTGLVLFSLRATHYAGNAAMQIKLMLLMLALANVTFFHRLKRAPPIALRACAVISLALWLAAIFAGRWIGFA